MRSRNRISHLLASVLIVALAVICSIGSSFAASGQKTITVTYKQTKLSLNNNMIMMRDTKGNILNMFTYSNNEYVPVGAVAKSLGLTATYDSKTNVIVMKTTTSGAIKTYDKNITPGGIKMRPWNGTKNNPARKSGNTTPGGIWAGAGRSGRTGNSTGTVKITPVLKKIVVSYKNIKVTLNGRTIPLKDTKGNVAEPFIYNGYEYVQITALAKDLGMSEVYDSKTNTVKLTKGK